MSKETLQYRCGVCGKHSDTDNLGKLHKVFAIFRRKFGGKVAFSEAEKILKHGEKPNQGSGHGRIQYEELDDFARSIYLGQYIQQLETELERCRAIIAEAEKRK